MGKHSCARASLKVAAGIAAFAIFSVAGGYWHERGVLAAQAPPGAKKGTRSAPAVTLRAHPQANFPELKLPEYQLPRPNDVVRATYRFAAEHPEVLSYMPCFCGCDMSGHRSNEDCFVNARARNGDVTEWQEHGMVCAMCLAVAEQSMKMVADHARVSEIRAEVERKYGHITGVRTDTPLPSK